MTGFIFVFGLLVTVVACGAVGGIWWAALRDGQTHDAIMRGEQTGLDESAPLRPRDRAPRPVSGPAWPVAVASADGDAAAGEIRPVAASRSPAPSPCAKPRPCRRAGIPAPA